MLPAPHRFRGARTKRSEVVLAAVDPVRAPESLISDDGHHCGEHARIVSHGTPQDHSK